MHRPTSEIIVIVSAFQLINATIYPEHIYDYVWEYQCHRWAILYASARTGHSDRANGCACLPIRQTDSRTLGRRSADQLMPQLQIPFSINRQHDLWHNNIIIAYIFLLLLIISIANVRKIIQNNNCQSRDIIAVLPCGEYSL